jgi:deoxyribose-phosphate aldolase
MSAPTYHEIAKMIDHGLLRPGTTDAEFEAGIDEALELNVASVCIQPHYLRRLVSRLAGSTVASSTVIGFPHGASTPRIRLAEAQDALEAGCQELDVVANLGKLRSGEYGYVRDELGPIVEATHRAGQKVKIILETALLDTPQKIRLCEICNELQADWAKTSTGFASAGATVEDVRLMRSVCVPDVEIKASGGIRTLEQVRLLRAAGASRIGTSSTRSILDGLR